MPDFDADTWSRNLRKPNVRDFNDRLGATFTLEDNQQEKDFFNVLLGGLFEVSLQ
jgi:hypothetical protein